MIVDRDHAATALQRERIRQRGLELNEEYRRRTYEFHGNGRFTATNIALNTLCSKRTTRASTSGHPATGTWKLDEVPDEGPGTRVIFDAKNGSVRNCLMGSIFGGEKPLSEMRLRHEYGKELHRRTTPTP